MEGTDQNSRRKDRKIKNGRKNERGRELEGNIEN
jgi:hypothetical protein